MTVEEPAALADKQKACAHRVIQPFENEEDDTEVCAECGHTAFYFKRKAGRIILKTKDGFPPVPTLGSSGDSND